MECGRPVNDVYKEFGRGSGNIRLTRCVCLFSPIYINFQPRIFAIRLLINMWNMNWLLCF